MSAGGYSTLNTPPAVLSTPAKAEPLTGRLAETLDILNRCHGLMTAAEDKLGAPRPTGASEKDPGPLGVHGLAMYLRTAAMQLQSRLEEHVNSL